LEETDAWKKYGIPSKKKSAFLRRIGRENGNRCLHHSPMGTQSFDSKCRQLASILKLPCDYFQSGSSQEKTNGFIYYNHQENEAKERLTRREILGIISLFSGIILLLILAAIAFLEPLSESAGGSQISGGITAYWNHYPLYAGLMIVSFGLTVGGILLVFLLKKHSAIWEKERETTEE
jgi:hypothetical protein